MSRDGSIELQFAGETRAFRLDIGAWRKVQEKCDVGPEAMLRRLMGGEWRVDDLREIFRQALVRGGMAVNDVDKLLKAEFDDLPLMQFLQPAQAIVMASLVGAPDEDGAEGEQTAGAAEASPAES